MSLKLIQLNDVQIISCLISDDNDDVLQFYCHDKVNELSYSEILPILGFSQRIRELNKRVHFPAKAVRMALSSAQPEDATLNCAQGNEGFQSTADVEQGGEQQEQQEHQAQHTVLSLKYRVEGAPAPLKWKWHLRPVDSAVFYRSLLKDALYAATYLNENLQSLLDVVRKKDKEIKQYRIEGAQLLRSTVSTEPFDVEAFHMQHKQLLADVAAYVQVRQVLHGDAPAAASNTIKSEALVETAKPAGVASTIPCSTAAADSAKTISPRNRKRKAMETGILHVERKVMQRRRVPQLQYKNTESQESDLDAALAETKPAVRVVTAEIKQETNTKATSSAIEPECEPTMDLHKNELDEIMQLINHTSEQTTKMLLAHNITQLR